MSGNNPRLFYPRHAEAVTPHDTNVNRFTALFVGVAGDVVLKLADDNANVTLKNVPSGSFLPLQTELVLSTGTTATDIVGLRLGA